MQIPIADPIFHYSYLLCITKTYIIRYVAKYIMFVTLAWVPAYFAVLRYSCEVIAKKEYGYMDTRLLLQVHMQ